MPIDATTSGPFDLLCTGARPPMYQYAPSMYRCAPSGVPCDRLVKRRLGEHRTPTARPLQAALSAFYVPVRALLCTGADLRTDPATGRNLILMRVVRPAAPSRRRRPRRAHSTRVRRSPSQTAHGWSSVACRHGGTEPRPWWPVSPGRRHRAVGTSSSGGKKRLLKDTSTPAETASRRQKISSVRKTRVLRRRSLTFRASTAWLPA